MSLPLPRAVRVFWIASLATFALALLLSAIARHAGASTPHWDALSDPLLGDLMEYPGTYRMLHTAAFFFGSQAGLRADPMFSAVAYPPLGAMVLAPLYLLGSPVWNFLGLAFAWLAVAFYFVRHRLIEGGLSGQTATWFPLSLLAISFPIARLIHQGNVELFVWVAVVAGIWAFTRGHYAAAGVLLGLAAGMKLYPALLFLLFLPRRSCRGVACAVGTFAGSTLLALWWLGPTVATAWSGSLRNVFHYQGLRASQWTLGELVVNHSVFAFFKLGALIAHVPIARVTPVYYVLGLALLCWAFYRKLWTMPVTNQVLAVTACMLALPVISYYHTLVHLYAPLLMLILVALRAQRAGRAVPGLQTTLLLFLPLLAPCTLLTQPRLFLYCGFVQSVVLVALFLRALQYPFPDGIVSSGAKLEAVQA